MRGLIRGSESRGIVFRCVLLGVACVLVLVWIGCAPATPSSTTPSSSTGMYDPASYTVDKAVLEEKLTYDATTGEYVVNDLTNTDLYEAVIRNFEEAKASTTVEERNKNLRQADIALEVIAYVEINYNKSVDKILGGYIERGRIGEIEPDSGEFERIRLSGEKALVVFMNNDYGEEKICLLTVVFMKLFSDTMPEYDEYIYFINKAEGYNLVNGRATCIGYEPEREGITSTPSMMVIGGKEDGKVVKGGLQSVEDIYYIFNPLSEDNIADGLTESTVSPTPASTGEMFADTPGNLVRGFKGVEWGVTRSEFLLIRPDVTLGGNGESFCGHGVESVEYMFSDSGRWNKMVISPGSESVRESIRKKIESYYGSPDGSTKGCDAYWESGDILICFYPLEYGNLIFVFNERYED